MDKEYEGLKLENQLCFPLYACSKEIVRLYKPYLDEIDLTYTQYITMMVLWEKESLGVKELGEALYLDSGTLTPLLKKLEAKGLVKRQRCEEDERCLLVSLTEKGKGLKDKALPIPEAISAYVHISEEEKSQLYDLLYKILARLDA